jgi:hypothetical protein
MEQGDSMTPYERVKAAWDSPARRDELHRAAEAMAAEGFTQQDIEEGLEELLLEVRAAGADDDTEEIINGVWDRLTGWCQEKWHIKTRPVVEPPPAPANGQIDPAGSPNAPSEHV